MCAVRIPVYERTVQLDSGAHTIPRYHAADDTPKAVEKFGNTLVQVAAHWQAKQDSFLKTQMHINVGVLSDELAKIALEEGQNFNPAKDDIGTYHDRVVARQVNRGDLHDSVHGGVDACRLDVDNAYRHDTRRRLR